MLLLLGVERLTMVGFVHFGSCGIVCYMCLRINEALYNNEMMMK